MSPDEGKEGLLPELTAIEAVLASLAPRTDRLNRERLMFLAGQASAAARPERCRAWTRWLWPAAFSAMTAVAAMLLVMLVVQPGQIARHGADRTALAPAPSAEAKTAQDAGAASMQLSPEKRAEPSPDDEARPGAQDSLLSLILSPFTPPIGPRAEPSPAHHSYPELRDLVLARGLDSWQSPTAPAGEGRERVEAPLSYRELLDSLLEQETRPRQTPRPFSGDKS